MPTVKTGSSCLARIVSGQVLQVHWMVSMNSQQKERSKSLLCSSLQWVASKHMLEAAVVNQMVLDEFKWGQGFPVLHFEIFYIKKHLSFSTFWNILKLIYDLKELFSKSQNKTIDDCSHALLFNLMFCVCPASGRRHWWLCQLFSHSSMAHKPLHFLWWLPLTLYKG